jgi:pimeloyl-ACP methyl ester carboxylesterase
MPETLAVSSVDLIAAYLWRPAGGGLVKTTTSRPKRDVTTHLVITLALALPLALPLMVASAVTPVASASTAIVDAANGPSRPASSLLPVSGCIPVPAAECGTIRVPLDRSEPGGPSVPIGYALVRHQDQSRAAIGTVVPNPGGPGESAIEAAPFYTDILAPLLADHDLLLIDPRGIGRSGPIRCGLAARPPNRESLTTAFGECRRSLGVRARGYTSAATADDIDAVRAHLGIRRLDLLGESYGTYLMTVYAQRHPDHVRSIVLSSAYPLAFDMWARPNARAVGRAILLMCQRSAGACDGPRTLNQLSQVARLLHEHPISYRVEGEAEPRVLDETALADIVYEAGTDLGQLPAALRAALAGDFSSLIGAAQVILPFSGSSASDAEPLWALAASLMCNDYPTLWNRHAPVHARLHQFATRRAALAAEPFFPFSKQAWTSAIIDRGNLCVRWPDRHPPLQRTSGPFADVPVLVLSGDLDANTPTEEGRQAARQFHNARVIEVPNVAHVPERASGCPGAILTDFIRRLQVGDTSCLADIPPIPVA